MRRFRAWAGMAAVLAVVVLAASVSLALSAPRATGAGVPRPQPTTNPASLWKAVAAGHLFSLGLTQDGTLWSWGINGRGQLGLGSAGDRSRPARVGSAGGWKTISAGASSLGLKTDGSLWSWGLNSHGQLGLGDTSIRTSPTRVGTDTDWKAIAAGGADFSLALKSDGTLWAWGRGGAGGGTADRLTPTRIGSDTDWKEIAAGLGHALALKTDGSLWAWGANSMGELGLGYQADEDGRDVTVPTRVGNSTQWTRIAGGAFVSLALRSDGSLWAWGLTGLKDGPTFAPVRVGVAKTWSAIAAGDPHFCLARKRNGTLWAWGENLHGSLGLGDTRDRTRPTQIGSDRYWTAMSAGNFGVLALKRGGTLWAWGADGHGQLGLGSHKDRLGPKFVPWPRL